MPRRRKNGKQGEPRVAASSPSTPSPVDGNEVAGPVQNATLISGAAGATPPRPPRGYTAASPSAGLGASRQMVGAPEASNSTANNRMSAKAQIRSCFYPKIHNINYDQEIIKNKMIEMVSSGSANVEVTLKHSGHLFTYAGCHSGAYAKNSFGNFCTAVGMFVLARLFDEAWGGDTSNMQSEFSKSLEKHHISISMELVTAVLGDNGQKPNSDYAVVTAVTELADGKPRFYSTIEMIEFCQKWRLPTNHVWLFSTRKSIMQFFKVYDKLCERTATSVCKALDIIADTAVPGSKGYAKAQGEILEGLIVRAVKHESSERMEGLFRNFPQPPLGGAGVCLGRSLREICADNISDKEKIEMLLNTVEPSLCPNRMDWLGQTPNEDRSVIIEFLQAHPTDCATKELQGMISLMKNIGFFPAAFKCYWIGHNSDSSKDDNRCYRIHIDVHNESNFRRYQQQIGRSHGLWPPYRGFFVDINLFTGNNGRTAELPKVDEVLQKSINSTLGSNSLAETGLADEDSNLMLKLNFLAFELRTSLIRDGLSPLFKAGESAYRTFYRRQLRSWGISAAKQEELSRLLEEWALYITRKCRDEQLPCSTYLEEAEPFLEQYANRSDANLALIVAAGSLVREEISLSISDEKDDQPVDVHLKMKGLIVFFAGMPGCLNSDLCKAILNSSACLGDNIPVHYMQEDLIKGKYWKKVADERRKQPSRVTLVDKNAPNEAVWIQIEEMCRTTETVAIPIIPDCEGTNSNPFSLEVLAVCMFRVLKTVDHSEFLEKSYYLLKSYHLFNGKNRREFEKDLCRSFGSLVKMPLLTSDRAELPSDVKYALDCGISLFRLNEAKDTSVPPSEGPYAENWALWKERLDTVLSKNTNYFVTIQVPWDLAVEKVLQKLKSSCEMLTLA